MLIRLVYIPAFVAVVAICGCAAEVDETTVPSAADELAASPMGTVRNGGQGANVRARPGTDSAIVGEVADGQRLSIACQIAGETVLGSNVWDYVPASGGYIADALVFTGVDGFLPGVSRCVGTPSSPQPGMKPTPTTPTTPTIPATPAANGLGQRIVDAALYYADHVVTGSCQQFSERMVAEGLSNTSCRSWCTDFAWVIWSDAGAKMQNLNGGVQSWEDYGHAQGTWKGSNSAAVQPGDVAVYANGDHAAIVTRVYPDGAVDLMHGNWMNQTHLQTNLQRSQIDNGLGSGLVGFTGPVAR